MRHRSTRLSAAVLALAALTRPALGTGCAASLRLAARGTLGASAPETPSFASERTAVEVRLVALGYDPEAAREAAGLLRPEDLSVLLENPRMMQRAGELDNLTQSYIIGGLIVAGVVALAVAGNGSVQIN